MPLAFHSGVLFLAAACTVAPLASLADAESDYKAACAMCHDEGVAGTPKLGDKQNWAPRIDTGIDTLVRRSIEGYQGESGYMPPRGGSTLSDEAIRAVVEYMVVKSR